MCLAAGSARQLSGLLAASVLCPELGLLPAGHSSSLGADFVGTLTRIWADGLAGRCSKALLVLHFGWEQLFLWGSGSPSLKKVVAQAPGGIGGCHVALTDSANLLSPSGSEQMPQGFAALTSSSTCSPPSTV